MPAAGTDVKVKVWATGSAEPGTWTLTASDSSPLGAGRFGIFFGGVNARDPVFHVDNFSGQNMDAPAAPTALRAVAVSPSRIDLAWTDASKFEDGFKIERSPDGSTGWTQIATVAEGVTVYSDTGRAADTTYHYRVRAYNDNGDSEYCASDSATTLTSHTAVDPPKDHLAVAFASRGAHAMPGTYFRYVYDGIGNRTSLDRHSGAGAGESTPANTLNQMTSRSDPGVIHVCGYAPAAHRVTVNSLPAHRDGPFYYADITVFCYFMNSIHRWALRQARGDAVLEKSTYGLFPAFIDGWLDAAPPGVTLVDGCESAYRYNSDRAYLEAAVFIKGDAQKLLSPANRPRYRAQVQVSYGVYLDAYWNPKSSPWYIDGLGGQRVGRLRSNLAAAMRCSDEYVWIYGEKFRWWPTPNRRVNGKAWPEALPGCDSALRYVRDPVGYGRRQMEKLRKAGKAANLARNGDFGSKTAGPNGPAAREWTEGGSPAGWYVWQKEGSRGTFTWDRKVGRTARGSARAAKVREGCFLQKYDVEAGQRYVVRAFRKVQGSGSARIRIRWQTAEDKWTASTQDKMICADGAPEAWSELFGVVEVPKGAAKLIILLLAGGQPTADDIVWFDDVELYMLE